MNKEILIISNYFPPETGAASNRIHAMVEGFSKQGYTVSVACPFPNYPQGSIFKGYKNKVYKKYDSSFGSIFRLWIWPTKSSNKFIRLLAMLSFSLSLVIFFLFKKTPKKIIIQYSPVFIGFTSVFIARLLRKKVILNVSDLWPLAGLEMGLLNKGIYYSMLLKMEVYCYKKAHLLLGQSQEILDHVRNISSKTPLFLYRNFPDFKPPKVRNSLIDTSEIKIVYAGLLGIAQGIVSLCQNIRFSEKVSFHIYGSGPEVDQIKSLTKPYINYHGELTREELHQKLIPYDLGFVPLKNRIYGSVPSKIFELGRLGIPLLYFAGGEGENIVKESATGIVIPVNDLDKLQEFINDLSIEKLSKYSKEIVQDNAIKLFDFQQQFDKLIIAVENI